LLLFKERVTSNFDRNRRLCKSVANGERDVNISGKWECGGHL